MQNYIERRFTTVIGRVTLSGGKRALVVGGLISGCRQTGNPVRIRDGPAAVTEKTRSILIVPLPGDQHRPSRPVLKKRLR